MPMGIPAQKVQHFLWEYKSLCEKHGMIINTDESPVVEAEQEDIDDHIEILYSMS